MKLTNAQIQTFQAAVMGHYDQRARHELPWRQPESDGTFDPYKIWVSELMLQQTQVGRVIPKYLQFLQSFPTVMALANAPLSAVLVAWQGLGYNRRAKFLWQAAQQIVAEHGGKVPDESAELIRLPGIGKNTAGAIMAYAHNQPALFVETNIRTVYFHHFFADKTDIADAEILDLLAQTIDTSNPREFYWALMDYGTHVKKQGKGAINRSKHYARQSKFEGSTRQIRGQVLRLLSQSEIPEDKLLQTLADQRAPTVLEQLEKEQLIRKDADTYRLA